MYICKHIIYYIYINTSRWPNRFTALRSVLYLFCGRSGVCGFSVKHGNRSCTYLTQSGKHSTAAAFASRVRNTLPVPKGTFLSPGPWRTGRHASCPPAWTCWTSGGASSTRTPLQPAPPSRPKPQRSRTPAHFGHAAGGLELRARQHPPRCVSHYTCNTSRGSSSSTPRSLGRVEPPCDAK